jgi:hypothetical protein
MSGCRYEPPQFDSQLGITTPCLPTKNFYTTVRTFLNQEILKYAEPTDQRLGTDTYQELSKLLEAADSDVSNCWFHSVQMGEEISDEEGHRALYRSLTRMRIITPTYETFQKPWSNTDIELLQQGLLGFEVEPDLSWMKNSDCIELSDEKNITNRSSSLASLTGPGCARPVN